MDEFILTDRTENGASDISGVKNAEPTIPDSEAYSDSRVADGKGNTDACAEISVTGAIENGNDASESEEKSLEAEFDALIKGRFGEVYRRRTESIIRRRLRSAKPHTEQKNDSETEAAGEIKPAREVKPEGDARPEGTVTGEVLQPSPAGESGGGFDYESIRRKNQSRPIENGLSGSSGIVTKINVSALDGEGVLSIIRRVGSGEKISFK